mmetsp:Transcript_132030/g.232516  ORF Transcript_132030/g.232516 Transcript_132030/m.232516 type:complete len:104 (-) Transcript_132030:594-905(-)
MYASSVVASTADSSAGSKTAAGSSTDAAGVVTCGLEESGVAASAFGNGDKLEGLAPTDKAPVRQREARAPDAPLAPPGLAAQPLARGLLPALPAPTRTEFAYL